MDLLCHTSRGEDIIFNVSGAPIRDAAGQINGGVIMFRDVTERLYLEQQIRYSERKLLLLVESNILGVMVIDGAGGIHEVNDRLAHILGYNTDELLSGAVDWRHLTPPQYEEALAQASQTFHSTGSFLPYEQEYLRKDGSRVPVLVAEF